MHPSRTHRQLISSVISRHPDHRFFRHHRRRHLSKQTPPGRERRATGSFALLVNYYL
jgi:hypothetical protein